MKKLVTISTVGSFAVGVIMMLIELASLGDEMKYLATFLVAFVVSFATIFSSLLLARELREQQKATKKFNRDFSQLRPEHVDVLRVLWEKKTIEKRVGNKDAIDWLKETGMIQWIKTVDSSPYYKLTEKGEDVCDRLIEKDWTL
ncbi:MAG: hypothetical protein II622_04865 [Thermoguttaceae bacterium]|nr:hypothetical protein [Thermoguttaceae bacterium]